MNVKKKNRKKRRYRLYCELTFRRSLWSVIRAQYFEQFCRFVRDGVHQTLAILLHVIFSLEQSKTFRVKLLELSC